MTRLLASRWTYITVWLAGFGFLGAYLAFGGDWRISIPWALAYVVLSFFVGWFLSIALKLHERLPKLDRYLLYPHDDKAVGREKTSDEWALAYAKYHLETGFRTKAMLLTPAEDGLICVPVLLMGIGLVPAIVGGVLFGMLHLRRFTYLDCMAKAVIYAVVCYVVLPHGLLTVVLGHFVTNGIAFLFLQQLERKLSGKLCSNITVETDARESSARGSL